MRAKVLTLRPDCGRLHMVRRYRQTCQKPEYAPALLLILAVAAIVGLLWGCTKPKPDCTKFTCTWTEDDKIILTPAPGCKNGPFYHLFLKTPMSGGVKK